jgi:HTH-type transcriptional regulator/antitoxin HigA
MHEKGLKQVDLPYLGTRSRVSEILSRSALTVSMIKALSIGLGISTDTLIGINSDDNQSHEEGVDWSKFPLKEMINRGWISENGNALKSSAEDIIKVYKPVRLAKRKPFFQKNIVW